MLKFDTASKIPKASCGNVTNFVLGIRSQIVQLKASFWFWVFPCKHPLRRLFRTRLLENMLHMLNNRLRQTRPWFVPLGSIWAELLKNTPAILTSRAISRMVVVCWRRCNMKQGCILHFLQLSKILSDCDAVVVLKPVNYLLRQPPNPLTFFFSAKRRDPTLFSTWPTHWYFYTILPL